MHLSNLEKRRKFLIAANDEKMRAQLGAIIEQHITNAQIFYANNGADALSKINNDLPHVLVMFDDLTIVPAPSLIEKILADKKMDFSILLLSQPDHQQEKYINFADQVVTGQINITYTPLNHQHFSQGLARALNYIARAGETEFYLKFLAPQDFLLRQGEKADNVYILVRGRLEASVTKNENKLVLGNIEAGEFVGEMAYINGEPRSADVSATADCELIVIPIDHLDHLLFQKPSWAKALMKTLSKRVKVSNHLRSS